MKKRYVALLAVIFIAGLGIFAYPIVSNFYNDNFQTRAVDSYQKEIDLHSQDELDSIRQRIVDYNTTLATGAQAPQDYLSGENAGPSYMGLDVKVDGMDEQYGTMLGVLTVPSIHLETPIFDGVNDVQLQRGVGVLPGTSLPVGGEGTHSVITGHRGLPTAKLFTNLPDVKIGDQFFIDILGEKLTYKVETINTIEPTDVSELKIIPGEDLVTLLTCTPYMINTHRLIVTARRTETAGVEDKEKEKEEEVVVENMDIFGWIKEHCCCIIILLIILCTLLLFITLMRLRKRLKKMQAMQQKLYQQQQELLRLNKSALNSIKTEPDMFSEIVGSGETPKPPDVE